MAKIPGTEIAGRIGIHLDSDQLTYVLETAEREQRSASSVARSLIAEAIEARRVRPGARRAGTRR